MVIWNIVIVWRREVWSLEKGSVVFGVGKCGYMEYSDCMEKGSVVFGVTNRVFMEYSNMVIYNHRCNIPCQVRIQIAMSCTIMMPLICDSSHFRNWTIQFSKP